MKHTLFTVFFFCIINLLNAQVKKESIIKINVPALVFKNFSFQYEKAINQKRSFAVAVRFRPKSSIPFQQTIADLFTDTTIRLDLARMGNIGITPEYRFYLGKKGVLQGLYFGPFISYNYYSGDAPINYWAYNSQTNQFIPKVAVFKGRINTFTAGLQVGAQWKLSNKLSLDWWIVGLNYGFNSGDFKYRGILTVDEQITLQEVKLRPMKELLSSVTTIDVYEPANANGAAFKTSGQWFGIRAMGINLGYRF
jgi:hypothetical protein